MEFSIAYSFTRKGLDHASAKVESTDNEYHPHVVLVENKHDLMKFAGRRLPVSIRRKVSNFTRGLPLVVAYSNQAKRCWGIRQGRD